MARIQKEKRRAGKTLSACLCLCLCLCLLGADMPALADANAQVEALRQLYKDLDLTELPAAIQCNNGNDCGHVYIDTDGKVKALCPFGEYLLTFDQPSPMSSEPVDMGLKSGNNAIDQSTSYNLTGGNSSTTVTVAEGRNVSLLLTNANINTLVLNAGSTAAVYFVSNSHVGTVKPNNATLSVVGNQAFDSIGESAAPGSLTVTGEGIVTTGSLYSVLSAASSGKVVLQAGALPDTAVANWKHLTLPSGSYFDNVTSLVYNGVAYPLCIEKGTGATNVTAGHSPLPDLQTGSYRAAISATDPAVCNVTVDPGPTEKVITATGGTLSLTEKCVLKSDPSANQDVEIQTSETIEMVSAKTSGGLTVGATQAAQVRLNGANSFRSLTIPSGASLTLSGNGSVSLGSVRNDGPLTIGSSMGVVSAAGLTGAGTISVSPQTNFSLPSSVTSLNGGRLLPTRIKIVEPDSSKTVANTRIQLKLGTGEMFTTTTDGSGLVTLWRTAKLTQVDVVALSGSDSYAAVIVNGGADADALPVIQSVTLDRTGSVVINATGAKSYGVQYIVGSQTADMKAAFDSRARRVVAPGGKCVLPGLRDGDRVTIRAYAAKEENVELTAATSDAFAFSAKQGIAITSKIEYAPGKQTKTYDSYPFVFKKKLLPTRYEPIEYWYEGEKLKSEPVNEGAYTAVIKVLDDDPVYLPGTYRVSVEIARKRILVYTEGTYKKKHEEDPYIPYVTDPLVGNDMVMGQIGRSRGESYGNHAYTLGSIHAVDEFDKVVNHYYFVLVPGCCMFIDWDFRHYLPVDPMSYIDPVYEEVEFSDGTRLRIQYRTSEVLNLGGTYLGTLVRDSDTRKPRPYTPSLRVRRGYDEALLILTADAEFDKNGGYQTDRDGNRAWRGRVLSLSYWQLNQLQRRHIQYMALSLKGTALMISLGDLTGPEVEGLMAANNLKKKGLRFSFELVPVLEAEALEAGEVAAKSLFAGRSVLMRMTAYLEYEGKRVDLSVALPNAWLLFDAAALLEKGASASSAASRQDVVETVNGRPVAAEGGAEFSPEESAAAQSLLENGDTSDQQRELAYTLLERAVVENGGALERFREDSDHALDSDIVVPYTASETRIMEFAALMRTRPFFIASFRQSGLYGLRIP